jgi:hypothetical protein
MFEIPSLKIPSGLKIALKNLRMVKSVQKAHNRFISSFELTARQIVMRRGTYCEEKRHFSNFAVLLLTFEVRTQIGDGRSTV